MSGNEYTTTMPFYTVQKIDDPQLICKIEFHKHKAIVLEPETQQAREPVNENESFSISVWKPMTLEERKKNPPKPKPKELLEFKRCSSYPTELLLSFILNNRIKMHSLGEIITPQFIFSFNKKGLLFLGEQNSKTVIKIKRINKWVDLHPKSILCPSDGSNSMEVIFKLKSKYKCIKITDPKTEEFTGVIQMKDGKVTKLSKLDLDTYDLSSLDFMEASLAANNPLQTPLDCLTINSMNDAYKL